MRRSIHISGKLEPFFGTLDENVRLLEDALRVRTHLHDTRLTVEGEQDSVDQAVKIIEEYNHLTRHGRALSAAEVKSLMRVATEEPQVGYFADAIRLAGIRNLSNAHKKSKCLIAGQARLNERLTLDQQLLIRIEP